MKANYSIAIIAGWVLIILFSSCQDNEDCLTTEGSGFEELLLSTGSTEAQTLVDQYGQRQATRGDLFILFDQGPIADTTYRHAGISSYFSNSINANGSLRINGQDVTKSEGTFKIFDPQYSNSLKTTFGSTVQFSVESPGAVNGFSFDTSWHFPKSLFAVPSPANGLGSQLLKQWVFLANQTLEWTPDTDNNKVFILIYETTGPLQSLEQFTPTSDYNFFAVPDNGSYTFKPSDFEGIADGEHAGIYLLRFSSVLQPEATHGLAKQHLAVAVSVSGWHYQVKYPGG